jgi:hypothetical protein
MNAPSSPHNNTKKILDDIYLPFGYRATHKVRPKITGQHAFEVLFSHIINSSLTLRPALPLCSVQKSIEAL